MNKEKRRVPKLRFPGFTEDWEQRKLGDIATFSKGNGYSKSDLTPSGDPIILYGRLYTNYETTISNVDTFVELKDKSVISQGGEVIVPASGETAEDISRASVVKNQGIIIGGDLNVIKVNHLLDPTFLALTISNGEQQKELSKRAQGKSVVHLHNSDLQEVNLTFPLLNEQKEISTLFEKMDNIITLHQRKLKHLNFKKKALLQKLFPKNGERHPELRFPEFTDAWEQRKLGDFYTFKNGLNKEKVYFGYGDSIVNFTDVFHNRQIYSSTLKGKVCVNKKELENYKVKEGDLFFTRTSETIEEIGFPAVVMEPMERVVFSGFVLRGRAEKYDPLVNIFKSYIFFTDNFRSEMKKKSSMTTRALTSGTALKEMYFSYPRDLEEQNKIGEILLRLDKIITLHQQEPFLCGNSVNGGVKLC